MTMNDVMDYSRYFSGYDEPPPFYHETFDLLYKIFVPIDDFSLGIKLCDNPKDNLVLHHFAYDKVQNRLLINNFADSKLHEKVFAVTSPDFSADSNNCFSCFNIGNILKARICAYRWQNEKDERVILTWIWGNEDTYKMAFSNTEKGSIVAVSSQAISNPDVFEKGIRYGIDLVQPDYICWYGKVFDFMAKYYDCSRIVRMQTRTDLLQDLKKKEYSCEISQGMLF